MRLPQGRLRIADAAVGSAYTLAAIWGLAANLSRVLGEDKWHSSPAVAFLVAYVLFDLLLATPGLGVAVGDRRGFTLTAGLSLLIALGAVVRNLTFPQSYSTWGWAVASLHLFIGIYCVVRLAAARNDRKNP